MEARCVRVPGQKWHGVPACAGSRSSSRPCPAAAETATRRPRSGEAASVVVYCSADKEFAELVFHAYEARDRREDPSAIRHRGNEDGRSHWRA